MNAIRRRSWEIPERLATPEHLFFNRRSFLAGGASALALAPRMPVRSASPTSPPCRTRPPDLYPAQAQREVYARPRHHRPELSTHYNNFYEFIVEGPRRTGAGAADPAVDGGDRRHGREAVRHRHRRSDARCRWRSASTATAASRPGRMACRGPVSRSPSSSISPSRSARANYRAHGNLHEPEDRAGPEQMSWYPWPYIEGLTMAEATNELAFLATGMYGHPMPKQHGAPLRLVVPWKYGFKSVKSIVNISFIDTAAEELLGSAAGRPNTASGPTSIPRCRIRAGARRASTCSAPTSACRR